MEQDFSAIIDKRLLGTIAVLIELFILIPYVASIVKGNTKPHIFSWVIWVILMSVALAAQVRGGAGSGAWVLGANVFSCFIVVLLASRNNEIKIARVDWIFFIAAILAIPLWLLVHDPLPSVILVSLIDTLGYGPTLRKAWQLPYEEMAIAWFFASVKMLLSIAAMENYSLVTCLYPAVIATSNVILTFVIVYRRRIMKAGAGSF